MKGSLTAVSLLLVYTVSLVGCNGSTSDTSTTPNEAQLARGVAEDFLISTGPALSYSDLDASAGPFVTEDFCHFQRIDGTYVYKPRQKTDLWYSHRLEPREAASVQGHRDCMPPLPCSSTLPL